MQSELVVGDSFNLLNTFVDYLPSDGWVLKTRFAPRLNTAAAIVLIATAENADYRTTASSATTSSWTPGVYNVAQWVEKTGQRVTLATGEITLLPDPATMASGVDTRSHVARTLANIEAMLEGRATKDVQEYSIGDRQLKHLTIPELLIWRDKYRSQLAGEQAGSVASKRLGRKIHVRF